MHHHFIDWPYRAVTRAARLLRRQEKGPSWPFANIKGYLRNSALVLIKNTLKRWLLENLGFGILIGGPGARAPNWHTTKYYVRCFGELRFRSSDRNCVIDAACNVAYLLLGEAKAVSMSNRFGEATRRASQRAHPHDEGKAEISDFTSAGSLGPVFQGLGGDLSLKKVKNIPPHGQREPCDVRFNWLFEKRIHGHMYLARLYEAGVVDHLVVIDSRRWPSLIYDLCDPYPLILSFSSLFQFCGSDATKVKITQLYEVIRNRRSGEERGNLKRRLLSMPRGVKRQRGGDY